MQEGDNDINRTIYIPFSAMDVLQDNFYISGIWLDYEGMEHEKISKTIRQSLALAHNFNPDDERAVFVFDAQKQLAQFSIITLGLKVLLTFVGTITLAIGGIGLMNIMLVSVTQRTREIGVEKALGARKRDILFQFLAEALVITAIGGVLGVLLSYIVSISVGSLTLYSAMATHAEAGDIRLVVAPRTLLIAVTILGAVGVVSGMFPAMRQPASIPSRHYATSDVLCLFDADPIAATKASGRRWVETAAPSEPAWPLRRRTQP